jgi:hypothetical protein
LPAPANPADPLGIPTGRDAATLSPIIAFVAEVLHEVPESPRPVARVRSTILLASRTSIVESGHGARYEAALDPIARRAIGEAVAGVWLPLEVARAHYRACDALDLGANAIAAIGRSTNDRVKGTLAGTFIRVFQEAGGSPWSVIPHWQRFWDRAFDGGALRVTKLGPKDARVDAVACSLCESHYFRHGLRGLSSGFIEVLCHRAYATEIGKSLDGLSIRYQWA